MARGARFTASGSVTAVHTGHVALRQSHYGCRLVYYEGQRRAFIVRRERRAPGRRRRGRGGDGLEEHRRRRRAAVRVDAVEAKAN